MPPVTLLPVPFPKDLRGGPMLSNLGVIWENFKRIRNHFPAYNIKDYGAKGDGVTDDAPAILRAYNAVRAAGRGVVVWPKADYLLSYGFHHPPECETQLSGSYLMATAAFGQGSIPSGAVATAFFSMGASVTSNAVLTEDYSNQSIIGDGATLDGNFLNQTGTPPGYNGILLETTPSPIEDNFLRVKNVLIQGLTITTMYRYGLYLEGVENCTVRDVKVVYAGTNATSIIGGKNILFDNVEGSWTRENLTEPEYGFGFWNEPNESWQSITNLRYVNCYAEYNYQGGFLPWNPGQDAGADIKLIGCKSFRNSWDAAATPDRFTGIPGDHHSSVTAAGFLVSMEGGYSGSYCIEIDDCTAIEEYQSGFKVKRSTGAQTNSIIRFKNPTAFHCVTDDADGYERAAISVVGTALPAYATRVEILNPTIISPPANTAGYMIGILYTQDIVVQNPTFKGPATYKAIYANLPAALYKADGEPNNVLDVGSDDQDGVIGGASEFFKPVRLPYFDQATEPAELLTNQLVIWKVANSVFVGIFNYYDASIGVPAVHQRYIPMLDNFGAANQLLKSNATGTGWKHSAVTIDESAVMSGVLRLIFSGSTDNASFRIILSGNVAITGSGGYSSYGVGVPGDANTERGLNFHDGVAYTLRSLATGTGTTRPIRHVIGTTTMLETDATGTTQGGHSKRSVQTGITAHTTQAQGNGVLTKDINIVSTVANANDVNTLPPAVAGMEIYIRNNGANTLQLFPSSGDNINGTGVDASVTLAAGASVTYRTADTTNWYS